jgi:hypothetical protein
LSPTIVALLGAAGLVIVVLALIVFLSGGPDEPTPTTDAGQQEEPGTTGPGSETQDPPPGGSLRDLVSELSVVGDFTLVEAADFPELIQAGATDSVTTVYEASDGTSVFADLAAFSSPADAVEFLGSQVDGLGEQGLVVGEPATLENEQGEELGLAVTLTDQEGVTLLLWTNLELFVAVAGPGDAPFDFYAAVPF